MEKNKQNTLLTFKALLFLIYILIGFVCAFICRQMKN